MLPPHISWSKIQLLHNVIRTLNFLQERENKPLPTIEYRAKVKLHGTNAAIQRTDVGVFAQSRSQLLSPNSDNKGFARWVEVQTTYFEKLPSGITVFGEWCGPGVEGGMAISALDRKVFAVFALQKGHGDEAVLEIEPKKIRQILSKHPDVFVLPWLGDPLTLDYSTELSKSTFLLNEMVAQIEKEDPWVKEIFGISGLGEGMVLYPTNIDPLCPEQFALLAFKAKGEKHRTAVSKKAVQIAPKVAASVEGFVDLALGEARLLQGVTEACQGEYRLRFMGSFIRWISNDVQKETVAELEAASLTWKQVAKAVSQRARTWYHSKIIP